MDTPPRPSKNPTKFFEKIISVHHYTKKGLGRRSVISVQMARGTEGFLD